MKLLKKSLSVFLAVLMLLTAMSVSFVAFAMDRELENLYKQLGYYFFEYRNTTVGLTNVRVLSTDENGYPIKTIVGDMNQYEIKNESDDYVYADDSGNPVRAISYDHTVVAKDNSQNEIRRALLMYLSIADRVMSTTYDSGNYTVPMVINQIKEDMRFIKGDDGEYLFLDGYTYLVNSVGELIGRSDEKTYEVVDGEIKYFNQSEDSGIDWGAVTGGDTSIRDLIAQGSVREVTLYEYANCDLVLSYFAGNFTSVNSGNWFHTYKFSVETDLETVLTTESLADRPLTIKHLVVEWTMNRSFDASGTKPQYYNNGYQITSDFDTVDNTRQTLAELQGTLNNYFDTYYAEGVLGNITNPQLISQHYSAITAHYDTFNSLSNEAKIAVFGQAAYSYVNLVTQLTPIAGSSAAQLDQYMPIHTYEKYTDASGNNVTYKVTTDKVTTIVSTIDDLLKSERVGAIIKTFIDFSDPKYEGQAFYGVEANTAQEVLYQVIQNFVFSDDIINLVLLKLYPLVTNLIDENLKNTLLNDNVGDFLTGIILGLVGGNGGSLQYVIYNALWSIGVGLTPAGVAAVWQQYGYLSATSNPAHYQAFQRAHDILFAARGGSYYYNISGRQYYLVGNQGDEYEGHRWSGTEGAEFYWGVNGDRNRFQAVLSGVLAPIAPLLAVILGNVKSEIKVTGSIYLVLEDLDLYDDVLVPILEVLGVSDITTPAAFRTAAEGIRSDASRNPTSVQNFLNTILNPLLDWVVNEVLADPISTVAALLPNLSYALTSGLLLALINGIEIPIKIKFGATIPITTLKIADMLGDKLAFLDSLQGILDLIGLDVDTGIPIVGYYREGEIQVYRPGMAGYDSNTMTQATDVAYRNANGDLSLYEDSEYNVKVTGKDDSGEYTEYVILDNVGWSNAAGLVVTQRNDTTINEYTTEVTSYYEYSVLDEQTGESMLYRTTYLPEGVTDYTLVRSIRNMQAKASLPAIMDYKLQACGTETQISSLREDPVTMTSKSGSTKTWAAKTREYIDMSVYGIESEGLVLLFIFRYLFSALRYRGYVVGSGFTSDYTLLDAFGLGEMLNNELVAGLKLSDIIDNITLHPDGAIAALYELFYKNEFGSLYKIVDGKVVSNGGDYTYDIDYVDYHNAEILAYAQEYNDYQYGTAVLYTEYWSKEDGEYVVENLDDIVDNVFAMLKLDNVDSIGQMLEGLLNDNLFNNEMLSTIASFLFTAIDSLDIDLATILNAALDVDYSKAAVANAMNYMFGKDNEVAQVLRAQYLREDYKYERNSFYQIGVDQETGEDMDLRAYDWGYDDPEITAKYSSQEIFIRAISALASPFAIIVQYLFCGEDLSVLGLINIPGYEIYHYAWIPFMEALGATENLISFEQFFGKVFAGTSTTAQNCDAFYYSFSPAFKFIENVIENPVEMILKIIPNLFFFISIGGLNDVVNNFLHFAYVLLDILQPVLDVYPILNGLLSNIRIGDFAINISIPLDLDVNQLVSTLIDSLIGGLLSFDIENKNIVLGQKEVEEPQPVLDENGNEMLDEEGNTIVEMVTVTKDVYAVGTLKINLPNIDLSTMCAGTITERTSISGHRYIYLNASGGADLITLLLRLVVDTLFYEDNAINIANFLIGFCQLDDEVDNDELLLDIFTYLNSEARRNEYPDKTMRLIFNIYKILVPIADNLGGRFKEVDFSIIELFQGMSDKDLTLDRVNQLLNAGGGSSEELNFFSRLLKLLREFFQKLREFFQKIFSRG